VLVSGGLAVVLLVLFGRLPFQGRWVGDLSNAAHGPAFMLITVILLTLLTRFSSRAQSLRVQYATAIAAAIVLGIMVELAQGSLGRDAELGDLWRDTLGVLAGAGGFLVFDPRIDESPRRRLLRRAGVVVAGIACLLILAPLIPTAAAYLHRHRDFPVLADFGSRQAGYFVGFYSGTTVAREALPADLVGGGDSVVGLRVRHSGERGWWGLRLRELYPDWRGHQRLVLDLANLADDTLQLKIRIWDRDPLRGRESDPGYRGEMEIPPRSREVSAIPLVDLATAAGRGGLDLSTVHLILLSGKAAKGGTDLYVIRVWLE
jgi:hypothetical protein